MKVIEKYRLFKDTYLFALDSCLAIVKVDKDGNIIKMTTFGCKRKEIDNERNDMP